MSTTFKYIDRGKLELAVLIPGWAFCSDIFEFVDIEYNYLVPERIDLMDFHDNLMENLKWGKAVLIGWSFGALLAAEFTVKYPELVRRTILLNVKPEYNGQKIEFMKKHIKNDMTRYLKHFYRRVFRGHDKVYWKWFEKKLMDRYISSIKEHDIYSALDHLAQNALPFDSMKKDQKRFTFIFGSKDAIVTESDIRTIRRQLPSSVYRILESGHMAFMDPQFSRHTQVTINKDVIKLNFSKNAGSYDRHSKIQAASANTLLKLLGGHKFRRILEIGCGTGKYTEMLAKRYNDAAIDAVDISGNMISIASDRLKKRNNINFIDKDIEKMRLTVNYDLATSNATLQWLSDPEKFFKKISANLVKGGLLCFSSYGPETFKELQVVVSDVFGSKYKLSASKFIPAKNLEMLLRKYFDHFDIKVEEFVMGFPTLMDFLKDIKLSGTRGEGMNRDRFMGKDAFRKIEKRYLEIHKHLKVMHQLFFVLAYK